MRCHLLFLVFFSTMAFAENTTLEQNPTCLVMETAVVAESNKTAPTQEVKKIQEPEKEDQNQESQEIQTQNKNFQNAILKTLLSLFGFVTLILLTIWFLRRMSHSRHTFGMKSHSLQILEKRLLSPKTTLYLMEVDGKKVVFAESMMEVKVLYTETPAPPITSPVPYSEFK
jgi:flagellar biogenesis protein FliO